MEVQYANNPDVSDIPLLGAPIRRLKPQEFYDYVNGLRKTIRRSGPERLPIIKGRVKVTPTKKHRGIYEAEFIGQKTEFEFDKMKQVVTSQSQLMKALACSEEQLKVFFEKKKFILI